MSQQVGALNRKGGGGGGGGGGNKQQRGVGTGAGASITNTTGGKRKLSRMAGGPPSSSSHQKTKVVVIDVEEEDEAAAVGQEQRGEEMFEEGQERGMPGVNSPPCDSPLSGVGWLDNPLYEDLSELHYYDVPGEETRVVNDPDDLTEEELESSSFSRTFYKIRRPLYATVLPSIRRFEDGVFIGRVRFGAFDDGTMSLIEKNKYMDPAEKKRERESLSTYTSISGRYTTSAEVEAMKREAVAVRDPLDDLATGGIDNDRNAPKQLGYGVDLNHTELETLNHVWNEIRRRIIGFENDFQREGKSRQGCYVLSTGLGGDDKVKAAFFGVGQYGSGRNAWVEIKPAMTTKHATHPIRPGNLNWRWEAFLITQHADIDKISRVLPKLLTEMKIRLQEANWNATKKDVVKNAEDHLKGVIYNMLKAKGYMENWPREDAEQWQKQCGEWLGRLNLGGLSAELLNRSIAVTKPFSFLSLKQLSDILWRCVKAEGEDKNLICADLYEQFMSQMRFLEHTSGTNKKTKKK